MHNYDWPTGLSACFDRLLWLLVLGNVLLFIFVDFCNSVAIEFVVRRSELGVRLLRKLVYHLINAREILVYLLLHGHIFFVKQTIEVVILLLHFWPILLHNNFVASNNLANSSQVLNALINGRIIWFLALLKLID